MAIFQDLVDLHGFKNAYNSVKRFAKRLRATEPERFDILDFDPGEEAQVDYGLGAPTRVPGGSGYRRPYLFVMVLRYSRKAFRKCVWKTNQFTWARLHEEAWRHFGGSCKYVVLDNLKEGVIKPDLYDPELNPVYAALLKHYRNVGDPCKVRDPDRKGTVEAGVKHTQNTALKGKKFDSIEEQNKFLMDWDERWASTRIHGTTKRQVSEMFEEERPYLQPLPIEPFRPFREETRTVDTQGCVIAETSHYGALPAKIGDSVKVRIYDREIEILAMDGTLLRRHQKAARRGSFVLEQQDRVFNPSRDTHELLQRAEKIGPCTRKLAGSVLESQGRIGIRTIRGILSLLKVYRRDDVEAVSQKMLEAGEKSFKSFRIAVESRKPSVEQSKALQLTQSSEEIRPISVYSAAFDELSKSDEHPT